MNEEVSFGCIVKEHRRARDLTQAELARRVACATITIRKIEADALRPSQQIAERLAMALAIPLEERAAFVRLARTSSPKTPTPPPLPTPPVLPEEIGGEDLTGRAIRGYELGERIGTGGFGVVYRAVQPLLDREVALKIILPRYANHPDFICRFEAEAQLVARLEHPYIVPLYDYWREPEVAYLVMRLLRGGSLQDSLRAGPLTLDAVCRLLEQIGLALHTAHRAGVIHRDIKPANVLLDEDRNGYLADFGIAKNLNLADQTQAGEVVGSPAYLSPEQIKAEPIRPQADIYCLGIMLYELLTGQKPFQGPTPVAYIQQHLETPLPSLTEHNDDLPETLDPVIRRATAKNPDDRYTDILTFIDDFRQAVVLSMDIPLSVAQAQRLAIEHRDGADLENPYKGLRAFGEADAAGFFGRDTLIQALLGRLAEAEDLSRFLAVIGPSGSGKSSVVRAGLIPALRQGGLPDSDKWFIVEMMPGSHPLEELEATLLRVAVNPPESLLAQLQEDERGLLRAVRRILPPDNTIELVLVIDQFEEIFTLCDDETGRVHLLDSLVTAVLDPRSRLQVVITLRADFTDRPLQYVDFGELVRQRTEFVLPLTPDELEDVILKPAERVGLTVEPGLAETIIQDLGNQPGTLPLVQYTLTELFEQRVGRVLTLGTYQASGGVRGALAARADDLYTELDEAGQKAARQLFLRLITPGEFTGDGLTAPDTRRRVLRSELTSIQTSEVSSGGTSATSEVLDPVIDLYGRHRLLTFDRDPVTRGPTVEVAHEALIREWGRLRQWLDEDREFLLWQQRLRAAIHQWQASEQDEGALLRGAPLAEAENWLNQRRVDLSEVERNFIQAGLDQREQRAAEREAQRQRELEAAQKLAETERRRAEEQTRSNKRLRWLAMLTTARELAGTAINNLDVDPERSILLALKAVDATYAHDKTVTSEAANALHQAVQASRTQLTLSGHVGPIYGVDYSPDGSYLVTAGVDGTVKIWDAATGRGIYTLIDHSAGLWDAKFSPDGTRIAASSLDGTVKIWNISSLHNLGAEALETATFSEPLTLIGHSNQVDDVSFSPDGTRLATSSHDGTAKVWDTKTGQELLSLDHKGAPLWSISFSPNGAYLATGAFTQPGGTVTVWDASSGQALRMVDAHDGGITEITFSQDGAYMATSSMDTTAKVWDFRAIIDGATSQELLTLRDHATLVTNVRFSPDQTGLATSTGDGKVKIWRLELDSKETLSIRERLTLAGHTGAIFGLDFNPDGLTLATGSVDGTARVWDLSPARELLTLARDADQFRNVVAFNPKGSRMAVASRGGAKVWDVDTSLAAANGRDLFDLSSASEMTEVNDIAFSPAGSRLVTANSNNTATVWDADTGKELFTVGSPAPRRSDLELSGVIAASFSPDGTRLATASHDGTVKIWDMVSQQKLLTLVGHTEKVTGFPFEGVIDVAFGPLLDGQKTLLATAGADGTAKIWDSSSGELLLTVSIGKRVMHSVAFDPTGTRLLTAGDAGAVSIWDISKVFNKDTSADLDTSAESVQPIHAFPAVLGDPWDASFSPDGRLVVSAAENGIVKMWDATTNQELLTLTGPETHSVAFTPDSKRLAVARDDGTVHLYVLPIEELVELAQSRVTRALTTEECQQFLHLDECPAEPER